MNKNKVLSGAFGWLFVGLLLCFITSYLTSINESIIMFVYGGSRYLIFLIAEFILAIFLSIRVFKMKPITAIIVYLLYTILTGLTLTGILLAYTKESICFIFLATALVFGSTMLGWAIIRYSWIIYALAQTA